MSSRLAGTVRCRVPRVLEIAAILLLPVSMALAQTPPTFTEYPLGGAGGSDITTGPDGALWFVGDSVRYSRAVGTGVLVFLAVMTALIWVMDIVLIKGVTWLFG